MTTKANQEIKNEAVRDLDAFIGAKDPLLYFVKVGGDRRSGSSHLRVFLMCESRPLECTHLVAKATGRKMSSIQGGIVMPYINMDQAFALIDQLNRAMVDQGCANAGKLRREWL